MEKFAGYHSPLRVQAPDTPIKPALSIATTGERTRAEHIYTAVKLEIGGYCDVSPTMPFIQSMFPVRRRHINDVCAKLVRDGVYDEVNKRWSWLPTDEKAEAKYYTPFVRVAEAIRKAFPSTKYDEISYRSMWIDRHSVAPKSTDKYAPLVRPDVLNILGMEDDAAEWDSLLDGLEGDIKLQAVVAWWLRVNVVIEIKPLEEEDILKHIHQLMGYLREILRQQLDRRFVPGLLFSRKLLAVWVADRSGVFGTQTAFDIHKEPKRFIQVILGCSILPPERLGWDTTMRLCSNPSAPEPEYVHSFYKDVAFKVFSSSIYTRHWVFEMPSNEDQNKRELFVTSRALSVAKAECMQGRATVVWAACKVEDLKTPGPHKIYVLKQCWRPARATREADMYPDREEALENHIGRVYSSEDVQVEGVEISTKSFVRCGLEHLLPPESPSLKRNGKREASQLQEAESLEAYLFIATESDQLTFQSATDKEPNWRVQTRILLEDHGWPLHQFRDLSELVLVVLHAAQALKFLHMHAKTLHRDISTGNVLICLNDSGDSRGCIVDLDYAKRTMDAKPTFLARAKARPPSNYKCFPSEFKRNTEKECTEKAVLALDSLFSLTSGNTQWLTYFKSIVDLHPQLATKDLITLEDLGFLGEEIQIPDYSKHIAQSDSRSATMPFASPEVLTGAATFIMYYPIESTPSVVIHSIIHDLESLFWCLTYICVTREGPGGKRRKELRPDYIKKYPDADSSLRRVNYHIFSCEDRIELAQNKIALFRLDEYESHVISKFHPYFERLKDMMKQWWRILSMAYRNPTFEAANDWIIQALQHTSKVLHDAAPSVTPVETREVDNFRKKALSDFFFVRSIDDDNDDRPVWDTGMEPSNSELKGNYKEAGPSTSRPSKKSRTSHGPGSARRDE
ncbi:hypothetical protein D9615_008969 [Tricholomella constricta]|uniref:Fungal-type protein kinase domain-containing protein n=1 Tax=Tricholomella constricta TaxID=117010 RepID=A0A8H5H0E1_9AGAR|nr:hypothetical protein D9615_008969 [Tricholomella constricta]